MAVPNQASMFDAPLQSTTAQQGESLLAHAERIDSMARALIDEVAAFRTRLLDVETAVVPMAGTPKEKKSHPIKICLSHFDDAHKSKFNEPAKIDGGKDSSIMKRLIHTYGEARVLSLVDEFFALDGDDWLTRAGYTVGTFSSRVAGLIASAAAPVRTVGLTPRTRDNARNGAIASQMIKQAYGNR